MSAYTYTKIPGSGFLCILSTMGILKHTAVSLAFTLCFPLIVLTQVSHNINDASILELSLSDLAPFAGATSTPSSKTLTLKNKRSINGPDDRVLWDSLEYPSTAIGRFVRSDGNFCSASLVGPRHVLTAGHCATPSTALGGVFQPDFFDVERFPNSTIEIITIAPAPDSPSCLSRPDWAVLLLSERLGDDRGYLGVKLFDATTQLNQPIFYHAAYPNDVVPAGQRQYRQCGITVWDSAGCDPYGPLLSYADVASGHSGGPLWFGPDEAGGTYVVSVASGYNSTATIFSSGTGMAAAVAYMRANYP
jgi:V8-like Glu-specific endopeptidase